MIMVWTNRGYCSSPGPTPTYLTSMVLLLGPDFSEVIVFDVTCVKTKHSKAYGQVSAADEGQIPGSIQQENAGSYCNLYLGGWLHIHATCTFSLLKLSLRSPIYVGSSSSRLSQKGNGHFWKKKNPVQQR